MPIKATRDDKEGRNDHSESLEIAKAIMERIDPLDRDEWFITITNASQALSVQGRHVPDLLFNLGAAMTSLVNQVSQQHDDAVEVCMAAFFDGVAAGNTFEVDEQPRDISNLN